MVTIMLAALLAVFGIVAVLAYVGKANARAVEGLKPKSVLVAKVQIPSGTPAGQAHRLGMLTVREVPANTVPVDAVSVISSDIKTLVTSAPIQPGQLLLREMLVPRSQRTGALVIPPGKVAVTMQLCLAADVGGYVRPGNFVAVYDTWASGSNQTLEASCNGSHQAPNKDNVYTQMVLPKVYVLSVTTGQAGQGSTSGTGAVLAGNAAASQGIVYVTLAATPTQAKQLLLLNQTGIPSFALTTTTLPLDPNPSHVFK